MNNEWTTISNPRHCGTVQLMCYSSWVRVLPHDLPTTISAERCLCTHVTTGAHLRDHHWYSSKCWTAGSTKVLLGAGLVPAFCPSPASLFSGPVLPYPPPTLSPLHLAAVPCAPPKNSVCGAALWNPGGFGGGVQSAAGADDTQLTRATPGRFAALAVTAVM